MSIWKKVFKKNPTKNVEYRSILKETNFFNDDYYVNNYNTIDFSTITPFDHFCSHGIFEDKNPNENFDSVWYKNFYEDVSKADIPPVIHYLLFGREEGLFANVQELNISKKGFNKNVNYALILKETNFFNDDYYVNNYNTIDFSTITPFDHFCSHGIFEDKNPNDNFDSAWYKIFYEDMSKADIPPSIHYVLFGREEGRFANEEELNETTQNPFQDSDEYKVLSESDYWDAVYYLTENKDINEDSMDPLIHYCRYGWEEGRNPSSRFQTDFYIQNNEDVKEAQVNPLYHYLTYGKAENREPLFIAKSEDVPLPNNIAAMTLKELPTEFTLDVDKKIDILIPVYNGMEYLEPLFTSIVKNSSISYRLLICDDKSPDEKVFPFLQSIKDKHQNLEILLLQNERNLGFVGTINRLVTYTNNHFVLLNTDTEVPPYWLERLMHPIFSMDNVATTTPFTNAGTICSFPNYLEDNENIMNNISLVEIDRYFQKVDFENTYIEIPTGVGFCMGVNKNLVEKIGMFDEVFGKGYGEENDFCQRAVIEGYKNIHVSNLFVYHKHGGSFSSETKKMLIEKNLDILSQKHPTYNSQVQETISKNELDSLRELLYFIITSSSTYTTLYIDHDLGGGAGDYGKMEVEKRLAKNEVLLQITYDFSGSEKYIIECMHKEKRFKYISDTIDELFKTINLYHVDEIFLNSLVSYPEIEPFTKELLRLQERVGIKLIVPMHDFFPLCPSYTLLNDQTEYCGVPNDNAICNNCLTNNTTAEYKQFTKETNMEKWRKIWKDIFAKSHSILCFSPSSKDIFSKAYPEYIDRVKVIPHDISYRYDKIYEPCKSEELRIGVLGGINIAKGALIVKDLVEYIEKKQLNTKIILIGDIEIDIDSPVFKITGRYKREELPKIVKELNITKFLIPSIWPETFSYTTDEIMQMGYPLTVFDIGAPAERVRKYELGSVIKIQDKYSIVEG